MRPHFASIMSGSTACVTWNVPVRLTAMIRSHSSGVMSTKLLERVLARRVHQDEHRAELAPRALDRGVDRRAVGHVDLAHDRRAALFA